MRDTGIILIIIHLALAGFSQQATDTLGLDPGEKPLAGDAPAELGTLACSIAAFTILSGKSPGPIDLQPLKPIRLNAREDFFTIELKPSGIPSDIPVWYAYQMQGFENDWRYTPYPTIQYTNVPGGHYTFQYKASLDKQSWTPAKTLPIHIKTVFYKTWWYWTFIASCIAFIIYRFYQYRMTRQQIILELQSKTSSLEKEKTVIQYETLKQQLNPHFLFNSLTSLRSLIRVDQKLATHFLDGLSKSYRYLLRSGDVDQVTLEEELTFVSTYVELQQTRFRSGLEVDINVPEEYRNRRIAPVAIQNLFENAIKHNTTSEDQPLRIEIFIDGDYVVVRNNLQRYRHVETSNKRGLAGLKSLYKYHTSQPIIITEEADTFTVKIPLL
jgi:hypothetical protein